MALSYTQSLGDGTNRNFSVSFQYLSQSHVSVLVNGSPVSFTWLSSNLIQTATAPANGAVVEVRRTTPRNQTLVDFSDGSTLTERDLDTGVLQSFFLAQEMFDAANDSLSINSTGNYDAKNKRITNLASPVNANDAVTKTFADAVLAIAQGHAQSAAASAGSASTAKDAAEAVLDQFTDLYLGAKTADPITDNDGSALQTGALYFNTLEAQLRAYRSGTWVALPASPPSDRGEVLLSSGTINNGDSVCDITLPTGYRSYRLVTQRIEPATAGAKLQGRFLQSGSPVTTNVYDHATWYSISGSGSTQSGASSVAIMEFTKEMYVAGGYGSVHEFLIAQGASGQYTSLLHRGSYIDHPGSTLYQAHGSGRMRLTLGASAIRLFFSTGNLGGGTWQLYGLRN